MARTPRKPDPRPLGSLTQPDARSDAQVCTACSSNHAITLIMLLNDRTKVRFTSCNECSHSQWVTEDGESLPRAEVMKRLGRQ